MYSKKSTPYKSLVSNSNKATLIMKLTIIINCHFERFLFIYIVKHLFTKKVWWYWCSTNYLATKKWIIGGIFFMDALCMYSPNSSVTKWIDYEGFSCCVIWQLTSLVWARCKITYIIIVFHHYQFSISLSKNVYLTHGYKIL